MTRTFCDRCDEELNPIQHAAVSIENQSPRTEMHKTADVELCSDGLRKLFDFIKPQPKCAAAR